MNDQPSWSQFGPEGAPGSPRGAARLPTGPARYRAVLDSLAEVVFQTDAAGNWTYLNRAWTEITGFAVPETLGRNFLEYVHPDEVEPTVALFQAVVSRRLGHCHHETRYRTAGGDYRWMELRSSVLYDEAGDVVGNAGTIIDISERRQAEERLADQTQVLDLIARGFPLEESLGALAGLMARHSQTVMSIDLLPYPAGCVGQGTAAARTVVTVEPHGPTARRRRDTPTPVNEGLAVPITATATGRRLGSFRFHRTDGPLTLADLDAELLDRGNHLAAIAIEREHAEEATRHRALHDPLTGLPNRTLLADRLNQALRAAQRHGRRMALLLLDLDHFKLVNDTLGHEAGDRVLREVAARLGEPLRASDTISRHGGDEFTVVLPQLARPAHAEQVARKIRAAIRTPVRLEGLALEFGLDVSIGIAVTGGSLDAQELLRRADVAMYRAKGLGGGHAVYDETHDEERLRATVLAGELRVAVDGGDLALHYQPKVELPSGAVVGVESLLRWRHPVHGLVPPAEFIPLAERTGSIKGLSLWVLREALAQIRRWSDDGLDLPVAVNLSAHLLHDSDLPDLVGELLASERLTGGRLELEITESAVMADPEGAKAAMALLTHAGVAFAIDDFGVGYSSLSYLKRLPVQSIKIDKSFVRDMLTDRRDATIVRSAIRLAHDFDITVVAEGVETRGVHDLLVDLGCDQVQGYHIARPMPADELLAWLRQPRQLSAQKSLRSSGEDSGGR